MVGVRMCWPGFPSANPELSSHEFSAIAVSIAHSNPLRAAASSAREATEKWCIVVATASDGDRLPTARWMRTASSKEAPLPSILGGHQQCRAAQLAEGLQRTVAGFLQLQQRNLAEVLVQPRDVAVQGVSFGAQQVHDALPTGTSVSDATSSALPTSPRTIEMMLATSVRTAIGSSASARLGMPRSRHAENTTSLPCAASTHCHEPSKTAMSPSSLVERDRQGAGVERVLLGPAQQAGPEGDLPLRHGDVPGHLGDGAEPARRALAIWERMTDNKITMAPPGRRTGG